jgi:hypothetical protein
MPVVIEEFEVVAEPAPAPASSGDAAGGMSAAQQQVLLRQIQAELAREPWRQARLLAD